VLRHPKYIPASPQLCGLENSTSTAAESGRNETVLHFTGNICIYCSCTLGERPSSLYRRTTCYCSKGIVACEACLLWLTLSLVVAFRHPNPLASSVYISPPIPPPALGHISSADLISVPTLSYFLGSIQDA